MKLIIFDFDGVIVDTEEERFKKLQTIAKNEGTIIQNESFSDIVGKKTAAFLKELKINKKTAEKINSELHKTLIIYPLISGVENAVKTLSKNYRLAIVTGSGKEIVNKTLEKHNLKDCFSFIITGEDFTSSKPDPECYSLAIKKAQLPVQELLVIEDSKAGILSAKNAGLIVWALKTKYNQNQINLADKILNSHRTLAELLTK